VQHGGGREDVLQVCPEIVEQQDSLELPDSLEELDLPDSLVVKELLVILVRLETVVSRV